MKRDLWVLAALLVLTAGSIRGEDLPSLKTERESILTRLGQLRQAAQESKDVAQLRDAMIQAGRTYEVAVTNIPEIKAAEAELQAAQVRLRDLMQARRAAEEKNKAALADVQKARDAAAAAYHKAVTGGDEGATLALRLREVDRRIAELANTP